MELPVHEVETVDVFSGFLRIYRLPILLLAISLLCIASSVFFVVRSVQNQSPIQFSKEASDSAIAARDIVIEVSGGVEKPGVYHMPPTARVGDAVAAAGGLSVLANKTTISTQMNMAGKLKDGMKVYVPQNETSHNISTFSVHPTGTSENVPDQAAVNINSSSLDELDSLAGVGPVTAQKIISGRPYNSLDDLVKKKVMNVKLYEKLKANLSL
jgi:competence protein ComEA